MCTHSSALHPLNPKPCLQHLNRTLTASCREKREALEHTTAKAYAKNTRLRNFGNWPEVTRLSGAEAASLQVLHRECLPQVGVPSHYMNHSSMLASSLTSPTASPPAADGLIQIKQHWQELWHTACPMIAIDNANSTAPRQPLPGKHSPISTFAQLQIAC